MYANRQSRKDDENGMFNKNVKKNSEFWVIMKTQMRSETETILIAIKLAQSKRP